MLRHRMHRVLVREGEAMVGMLSQLELMGFVATHSHLIALQIDAGRRALPSSGRRARQIDALVRVLHQDGIRVELIASLVHELNRQAVRAPLGRCWRRPSCSPTAA